MRIVIDMQGAQNGSRFRGIGRYTLALAKSLVRNKGHHEVLLLLSGLFPNSIEVIRSSFENELLRTQILVWDGVAPASYLDASNDWRRTTSQYLREAFIASLNPDVLFVTSMFEGAGDDSVTSVGTYREVFTACILYDLIPLIYKDEYLADKRVMEWYEDKITHFKKANVWFAISNSSREEGVRYLGLREDRVVNVSAAVGGEFKEKNIDEAVKERVREKFGIRGAFLLYSGATDPRKNLSRLIEAYAKTSDSIRGEHQLVLAGGMPPDHVDLLAKYAAFVGLKPDEVVFTGRVSDDELVVLYNTCKAFVFPSYHEGFGLPALEAMACGAPTIGSNVSSIPEVIGLSEALFDPFSVSEMSEKITEVLTRSDFREKLIQSARERRALFSWDETAKRTIAKLENLEQEGVIRTYGHMNQGRDSASQLIEEIAHLHCSGPSDADLMHCARSIASLVPRVDPRPKLFVDVSELHRRDSKTGIQRVVRSVASVLVNLRATDYEICLVYATEREPYRCAVEFSKKLAGVSAEMGAAEDEIIEPRSGDIFLGLDFHDQIVSSKRNYYKFLRERGILVLFVVYDLLPITLDKFFPAEATRNYRKWLQTVSEQDGLICISRTVSDELRTWLAQNLGEGQRNPRVGWFHLGGDLNNSLPTCGRHPDADLIAEAIRSGPSFLVVGTVEPRKGQSAVLAAFEVLWEAGVQVILIIVGKQGWMVEELTDRIINHPELGKRLFWLDSASDEYLEELYRTVACLIAASEGEGFGLPLIEAARHRLAIIARDIPVFREVAGEHAFYFQGVGASDFAEDIVDWLQLYQDERHPVSDGMPWLTWKESAEQLTRAILDLSSEVGREVKRAAAV